MFIKTKKVRQVCLLILQMGLIFSHFHLYAQGDSTQQKEKRSVLTEVVITGTKTAKRKTESPVIVNILDSKTLHNLQVCNLSEGLKFQPGLRIETDCQTCNYTQLRMNGLQGGYSQILINGRPIFSPLMGLYGMEQLPVNMIERIEVVRGGGSSLYGSSAIGGTVNVITKLPKKNGYEINSFIQSIEGQSSDLNLNGNATIVHENQNTGLTFYLSKRNRAFYDANNDQFSELPKLENTSIGMHSFYILSPNQKLEVALSHLNEYRFGGDMVEKPAYLTLQSEERTHAIWMGSVDYQINFKNEKTSLILYTAFQTTKRNHYTGIFPDSPQDIQNHILNPPYGISRTSTIQGGFQINHEWSLFKRKNVWTIGSEIISDDVFDQIASYHYLIRQQTVDWGTFIQSDWNILKNVNVLSGLRIDRHNLLNQLIFSPRIALLYQYTKNMQLRLSYGTGFRAPQAFDKDLHIAFAGGGVSRVRLSSDLREERSQSLSLSVNYDKAMKKLIYGYTLEVFHTYLQHAFVMEHFGRDSFGEVFEKRNGQSAMVQGITAEWRTNFNRKIQFELGFTWQESSYETPISYIQGIEATNRFLRTPQDYGFFNLQWTPNKRWNVNLNGVYTGQMPIAHFGGAENFSNDAMVLTNPFFEWNSKITYCIHFQKMDCDMEVYGGLKNILNNYQSDFDTGKNRDSNYIYGPNTPRIFFLGIKFKTG